MSSYTLHINLYDLLYIATIVTGLNFTFQLWLNKSVNRQANKFLALALSVMILWIAGLLGTDMKLWAFPLQFSLAFGPFIYFYVRKATHPARRFVWKDLLHFCPVVLEQGIWLSKIASPVRLLAFLSIGSYLYLSHKLIEHFYNEVQFSDGDRYRLEWRWLDRLLISLGIVLLLWIPLSGIDYFVLHLTLERQAYYTLSLLMAVMIIRMGAVVNFRTGINVFAETEQFPKSPPSMALKQKGRWLKKTIETRLLYKNPELSVSSLAKQLNMPAHELSRIINAALKKNFNDFINEYRIREVVRKMQDPAYDRLTLLGIAFESGFNSKTTFNRAFRQMTGENPAQYKSNLKKERPFSNLEPYNRNRKIVLHHETAFKWSREKLNRVTMFGNYFKIAWRNLAKSKGYTIINISGLALGMAVAILIGLWINDELSFDTYHKNYKRIAQVLQNQDFNTVTQTQYFMPFPIGNALRQKYGSEFKYVVMSSMSGEHYLSLGEKALTKTGIYMEPDAPAMLSLKIIAGSGKALVDPGSILISQSTSKAFFAETNPVGKTLMIDNKVPATVGGVYEDMPDNTTFKTLEFIAPWAMYVASQPWVADSREEWGNSAFQTFVQIADNTQFDKVSAKIRNIKYDAVDDDDKRFKPAIFLHPMSKWHLYSDFKNGSSTGGRIQFVWLFGIIGVFVLILACINFMNLSTARSEKRAKEVGIRKTIGSLRSQLIWQFFNESFLVVILAFIFSLLLVILTLPFFNEIASKQLGILWTNYWFWLLNLVFIFLTGTIAGSYPALYLSSFEPVKVLKGTFRAGRFASLPRKILVVVQFSVSIILTIGTIVVLRQVNFAKDRPIGYDRTGLIMVEQKTNEIVKHFDAFRTDLLRTGAVEESGLSHSPLTGVWRSNGGFQWKGKDPSQSMDFATSGVSQEFGRTVGWQFTRGRDFSRKMATDSSAIVINEAAVKYMGLKNPVGELIRWNGEPFTVIGVIKNMIMESPYKDPQPTVFNIFRQNNANFVTARLKPGTDVRESLSKVESIFKKYSPAIPFNYKFVDQDYAYKFENEERIGKLATFLACLAVFISCLGLFGMASFMAEQRIKEIGVRKVLGASVFNLWGLLSKDFVVLIIIALSISTPLAYYFMRNWLNHYQYHTKMEFWIFMLAGLGALVITLLTVSYQSIKAAMMNPVKSLRSE